MSTTGIISRGSIIEINGSLARSFDNESVNNLSSIPNNSILYIYAVPINEKEVVYQASTNVSSWNTEKCGWYYNANRAVIRATKDANGVIGRVTKMSDILNSDIPSNSGGTLIYSRNYRSSDRIVVNAGWYRFEMASGLGKGNGGNGSTYTGVYYNGSGAVGVASTSSYRSAVFNHQGGEILIHVGGNGYNGEAGAAGRQDSGTGNSDDGSGSGSGAGEETFIITGSSLYTTGKVESGKGGNGGNASVIFGSAGTGHPGGYFGLSLQYGGTGFDTPHEDYGGCGGNGGGINHENNSVSGGLGGSISAIPPFTGSPGSARQWGDGAAGYCNIYQL